MTAVAVTECGLCYDELVLTGEEAEEFLATDEERRQAKLCARCAGNCKAHGQRAAEAMRFLRDFGLPPKD